MFPCYSWNTRSSRHTPDIYHSHHPHRPHRYPSNAIPGRGTRRTVYRSYLPRAPLSSRSTTSLFPHLPPPPRFQIFTTHAFTFGHFLAWLNGHIDRLMTHSPHASNVAQCHSSSVNSWNSNMTAIPITISSTFSVLPNQPDTSPSRSGTQFDLSPASPFPIPVQISSVSSPYYQYVTGFRCGGTTLENCSKFDTKYWRHSAWSEKCSAAIPRNLATSFGCPHIARSFFPFRVRTIPLCITVLPV